MILEDLRPNDAPDYMTQAWLDCIRWAIQQPEIIAWFREETGNRWSPGGTVIERMVDDATGGSARLYRRVREVGLNAPEEE